MKQEINITTTEKEVVIREGQALPLKEPRVISFSGDINSITNYMSQAFERYGLQKVQEDRAIVEVDKNGRTIVLHLDPENPYGGTIKGTLSESEELKQFAINTATTYNREQFVNLIKFSRVWFDSKEEHQKVLDSIQKMQIKTESEIQQEKSNRGNVNNTFIKKVNGDIPQWFALNIPIFKGFSPVRIQVEICFDVSEGQVRFWLESTELHELTVSKVDEIFESALAECAGFVKIYK